MYPWSQVFNFLFYVATWIPGWTSYLYWLKTRNENLWRANLGWGAKKNFGRLARDKILSTPTHSKSCIRPWHTIVWYEIKKNYLTKPSSSMQISRCWRDLSGSRSPSAAPSSSLVSTLTQSPRPMFSPVPFVIFRWGISISDLFSFQ